MGQDYRLVKLYEQLYKQQEVQNKEPEKPRSLQEAYSSVLEEQYKYAIYAKELKQNKIPPETIDGAQKIGYTEFPQRLRSMLNAVESVKAFEELTPKWKTAAGFSAKYASQKLVELGLSVDNLLELARQKESLTNLQTKIASGDVFNFKETIVNDALAALKNDESLKSTVEKAFDYLVNIKPTVGGAAAGKGELVATVFTNAIKPDHGDLGFVSEKGPYVVELKYGNSRFGKENSKIIYDKGSFLKTLRTLIDNNNKFDPTLSDKIINIRKKIKEIKKLQNSDEHIKPQYFEDIERILRNPTQQVDIVNNKIFSLTPGMVVAEYLKDAKEPIKPEQEIVKAFKQKHKTIVEKLRELLNVDKEHNKLNPIPVQAILDYASNNPLASILKNLFTRNIGLTSDNAATLFCSMYNQVSQEIATTVLEFFKEYYHQMVLGHKQYLDAIVFAFNLDVYSKEDNFQGLVLINDDNNNAISFNTPTEAGNVIKTASAKFLENFDHISIRYTNNIYRRLDIRYTK